jgi:hypothetical protein
VSPGIFRPAIYEANFPVSTVSPLLVLVPVVDEPLEKAGIIIGKKIRRVKSEDVKTFDVLILTPNIHCKVILMSHNLGTCK